MDARNETNSGVRLIPRSRSPGRSTAMSAATRPGSEASTTTRPPRNTASSTSWVTISTVVCVSVQIRRISTCMSYPSDT